MLNKITLNITNENIRINNKKEIFKDEIVNLKQQEGKNIFVGSPSLIVAFAQLDVIDEYQLAVHPTVLGRGLTLFKHIKDRIDLKLLKTKTFGCESVVFYYEPIKKSEHS